MLFVYNGVYVCLTFVLKGVSIESGKGLGSRAPGSTPLPFLDMHLTGDQKMRVRPLLGRQHSFTDVDREIFSMVILSHSLIQEGQSSVSGERMCKIWVNRLED